MAERKMAARKMAARKMAARRNGAAGRHEARRWLMGVLWMLLLGGCDDVQDLPVMQRYEGPTMGTVWHVTARCERDVQAEIEAELAAVNAEMSTYIPDSVLSRFNRAPVDAWFAVPSALVDVVDAALALSASAGGAYDVTVGPLVNLWGFGPTPGHGVPDADAIAAARAEVGYAALSVQRDPPALRKAAPRYVDLSSIAKGHGVDRVFDRLVAAGCSDLLVEVGGEVRSRGRNASGAPWRIGVEVPNPDPVVNNSVQRIVRIENAALATSGDYHNFIEADGHRYSHTINPVTGRPVEHALASVTVLHPSCMWADGYATLLSVLGPDAGWDYAVAHNLAVLFIIRRETGFEERYTPAMAAYVDEAGT